VPSFAITSGVTAQEMVGTQGARRFPTADESAVQTLRPTTSGDDLAVTPYVGGNVELMSPALSLPGFPRFFASAEVLPSFAPERTLAQEGNPSRIRGSEVGAVLAVEEDQFHFTVPPGTAGPRQQQFGENDTNGQGTQLISEVDSLIYGAKVGVAFAFQYRGKQMRIKPSAGWLHYKVTARGYLVDPSCGSNGTVCTNVWDDPDLDNVGNNIVLPGFLRESILQSSESGAFDGVGPGVDLEMDTGRYGPLGVSLFAGFHAYYIPGDRDIFFAQQAQFSDIIGTDTDQAAWHVRVDPWVYRAGIGIRFAWLGGGD
jgi:hypothetical protein